MIISFQTNKEILTDYLRSQGFIELNETVMNFEKPGEGNMNFVARVHTQKRSIIIKQANPFVQKYPQIRAPQNECLLKLNFTERFMSLKALLNPCLC